MEEQEEEEEEEEWLEGRRERMRPSCHSTRGKIRLDPHTYRAPELHPALRPPHAFRRGDYGDLCV